MPRIQQSRTLSSRAQAQPGRCSAGTAAVGLLLAAALAGCAADVDERGASAALGSSAAIDEVRSLASANGVTPIPPAPPVSDELFALGQALAFDKILSGNRNISCMTCHHPQLDTDDNRHLSLGEGGLGLGHERVGGGIIPRNAPPLFNLHALDSMFWDMRVDGSSGTIHAPTRGTRSARLPNDVRMIIAAMPDDITQVFDFGVVSAQAMFPVLSRDEMRGQRFTNAPNDNELDANVGQGAIWAGLMARLGATPEYVAMFEAAYPGTRFEDMSFAHAANAIAGFEIRAFEARGSRWQQFLEGDDTALTETELRGARAFFQAGCANCHNGPMLTDGAAHNTGLAQFGPGKEDGPYGNDDFGVFATTHNARDRYAFRTAPLINISLTGPWGHAGQFSDLRAFVEHYQDPEGSLRSYDMASQIHPSELFLLDMRADNTEEVVARIDPLTQTSVSDVDDLLAFLETLTDDASRDLAWTIPSTVPSGLPVSDGTAPYVGGEATGTVTFADVGEEPGSGLDGYERVPSARNAIAEHYRHRSEAHPMNFFDMMDTPLRYRGMPGVAVFDYDGDGDEDVYATNGPGAPNSLLANQLVETGSVRFVDRAADAGVEATATDSSGVCYGDIDNDGDHDLFVVADRGRSHLFRNNGDGSFEDISSASGAAVDGTGGTSCAFGDIDGDGLLDLFVARAWHQENLQACFFDPFGSGIQHNELYLNVGDGVFADVSHGSGIRNVGGLPPWAAGAPTITWAVSLVDYDLDGDVDIFTADDQCGMPNASIGGISRGFLQIFDNDGTGHFTNRTVEAGTNHPSAWMGMSFGDFNSDGLLDFFSPSFGDWGKLFAGAPVILGDETSRWFLGAPGRTFVNPGVGELQRMPFGWGTSARDFDNDADTDITFHGGMDLWFMVDSSNPGTMLLNDGDANFGLDRGAFQTNHSRRTDSGVAAGDLNGDGFADIVTVSNFDIPEHLPLMQYGGVDNEVYFFSVFDTTAYFTPVFELVDRNDTHTPTNKLEQRFSYDEDIVFPNGTVTVELNSADNGNGWVSLRLVGSVGLSTGARANRDAIGAMVTFTPDGGRTAMAPVLGGSSHLSQDSLTQGFGLGSATRGTADILWPGGTRNRLYDVANGEQLVVPELACSYDTTDDRTTYAACVDAALSELSAVGLVDGALGARLRASALRAYDETH